ncbi:uncharacterized protein DUF4386 [Maritalea mobilis]|uniref:Uncharacterized protein DUF4386 n=1 Tax=Maritalea mobilis TaxID=483324 RepID=A0A4R6VP27_9HYPH|nr:DUF4386 domain-containing protein [Maritalea mobilis]TDQ63970.1 uncharacterized protein DUF4386 [Maritalea mobilis]
MTQALYQNKNIARLYGLFFIATFLAYGFGYGILDGLLHGDAGNVQFVKPDLTFILCVIAMVIVHSLLNFGLLTIMFRVIEPFSPLLSLGFLGLGIMSTVALLVGGIALMLMGSATLETPAIAQMLYDANFYLYQTGMTLWGVGGLLLCAVLWRTMLVPRIFAIWGMLGYSIFIVGTLSEFFQSGLGVMLSLPGGFFEIGLSIWLIAKGFNQNPNAPIGHQAASSMA